MATHSGDSPASATRLSRLHLDWDQQPLVLEALHRVIRTFGPRRCMFASNAPVDQQDDWPPSRVFKVGWAWAWGTVEVWRVEDLSWEKWMTIIESELSVARADSIF